MKKVLAVLCLFVLPLALLAENGGFSPIKISAYGVDEAIDSFPRVDTVGGLDVGLIGTATPRVYGVQVSIMQATGMVDGLQLAGLTAMGRARGIRASFFGTGVLEGLGVSAISLNDLSGIDLSLIPMSSGSGLVIGALVLSPEFNGVQIGAVNYSYEKVSGVQLGIFNYAGELDGVQIGVLNIAGNGFLPAMIGFNAAF